jgi:uncharacterized BrkB/YihY/UPF0761 family membrane protein
MRENSGIALAIAASILGFFVMLAFVIVVLMFGFLFVYAIVKAFGPEHASPTTVLVGLVVIVGTLTVALTTGIGMLGRSMTPRRRRRWETR